MQKESTGHSIRHKAIAAQCDLKAEGLLALGTAGAAIAVLLAGGWPRWAVMWGLAVTVYGVCKWLSWQPVRTRAVPLRRAAAYFLAWPGLDAPAFLTRSSPPPRRSEWLFAAGKLLAGLVLLLWATRLAATADPFLAGWVGMVGIVFTLHFGLFDVLSCFWRVRHVAAEPLMDWPVLATSVGEFWGRRWNRAFRDLAHRRVFRPLTARLGLTLGSLLAFVFSGLVHDLVITVPAGGGYGGPTLYFLIQGIALHIERSTFGRSIGLGRGVAGWLFTVAATVLPVECLFPRVFVLEVIVPFLLALRGGA